MDNKRENKIIIYIIIISIILIYIALLFVHSIIDRGKLKNTVSAGVNYPGGEIQGEETNNNNNKGNTQGDNQNNTPNNNQTGTNGDDKNQDGKTEEPGDVVDNHDRFRVLQGNKEWSELKELDIFNNSYFKDESIIAPGISGKYSFTVENTRSKTCIYDMSFTEENIYNINMLYKLKLNGKYINGDENNWVKYSELSKTNLTIESQKTDVYTIEWKWQDNDNDTEIGETDGAYYKMHIKVVATEKDGV